MPLLLVKITLMVEASESEADIHQQVEYALNSACTQLEQNLTDRSITYDIREVIEL